MLCLCCIYESEALALPKMHTSFVARRTNDKYKSPQFSWPTTHRLPFSSVFFHPCCWELKLAVREGPTRGYQMRIWIRIEELLPAALKPTNICEFDDDDLMISVFCSIYIYIYIYGYEFLIRRSSIYVVLIVYKNQRRKHFQRCTHLL